MDRSKDILVLPATIPAGCWRFEKDFAQLRNHRNVALHLDNLEIPRKVCLDQYLFNRQPSSFSENQRTSWLIFQAKDQGCLLVYVKSASVCPR